MPTGATTPTKKGARTRERILAAASELMLESGADATRLADVQAAAQVGPSQIYHFFTSKADLVRAVITYRQDTIVGAQQTALGAVETLDDLRRWADHVISEQSRLGCRGGCPIGSLASELAEVDDEARRQLCDAFDRWTAALRHGLLRLAARGALPPSVDAEALATTLLAVTQGGLLLGQAQRSTEPLRSALFTVLALVESAARPDDHA